jgi:hypothetical protein
VAPTKLYALNRYHYLNIKVLRLNIGASPRFLIFPRPSTFPICLKQKKAAEAFLRPAAFG